MYGQLLEQYRVPMQRLYAIAFKPSSVWMVALTGHTVSQGAFSQWWQVTGCVRICGSSSSVGS